MDEDIDWNPLSRNSIYRTSRTSIIELRVTVDSTLHRHVVRDPVLSLGRCNLISKYRLTSFQKTTDSRASVLSAPMIYLIRALAFFLISPLRASHRHLP